MSIDSPVAHVIVPVFTFLLLAGASLLIWRAQIVMVRDDVHADTLLAADGFARRCQIAVQDEVRPVRRLAREVSSGLIDSPERFELSVRSIQQGVPSLELITWIGPDGEPRASASTASNLGMPAWAEILPKVRAAPRGPLSFTNFEGVDNSQWFLCPIWRNERSGDEFAGVVAARGQLAGRIQELMDDRIREWFAVEILDDQKRAIFAYGTPAPLGEWTVAPQSFTIGDQQWTVKLWPTHSFIESRQRKAPALTLMYGLAIALMGSWMVRQALMHRLRDQNRTREHLDALEAANQVSAAIAGRRGASTEILQQLASVAGPVLGMSRQFIMLFDKDDKTLKVVFRQGANLPPETKDLYRVDDLPSAKYCMATGEVVAVGDALQIGQFSAKEIELAGMRSVLVLPMVVSGEPIGVIMLADSKAKVFTDADLRMAKLLANEAAVALLNERLHEEMDDTMTSLRQVLQQRETLYAVNSEIQHAGSPRIALERIAELAPRALDVDVCAVILKHEDDPDVFEIAAVTDATPPFTLPVNTVGRCEHASRVVRTRQPFTIEDAASDSEFQRYNIANVGSAMYVPLTVDADDVLGILSLMRRAGGAFAPEQVRLAQVFAARAAGAIHAARLYERTCRQAETNATLLRELNHRVKNNLAGIVALLSVNAPSLPERARQWLDRAIERIGTMARAHDLFSGGMSGVGMSELVNTTLATTLSVRGDSVEVETEMEGIDVSLSTDQAITLAMVLHELTYNALHHALVDGGRLLIRGRKIDPDSVVIDVIDQPLVATGVGVHGHDSLDAPAGRLAPQWHASPRERRSGGGMGLDLVRGLVGRELRGRFSLDAAPGGGTVATVEFSVSSGGNVGDDEKL